MKSPLPSPEEEALRRARAKIAFDLDAVDDNGLIGSPGGKRSVAYEFCIPREQAKCDEVRGIDPSVRCFAGTPGRIRCGRDQYLCVGQGGTRATLLALACLEYVERIMPFYGE